ncbi:MAG: hypothetical protein WCS65_00280 [Verrucomicrobiae bacterium]
MKPTSKSGFGIRGTIMIFALLVILGGALVLAAWAQMLSTRAAYPDTTAEGVKNRIAIANGRALARQFLLEQMALDPGSTNRTNSFTPSCSLANNWGGFYLFFVSRDNNIWTNTNFSEGNPFSTFGGKSFVDASNTCWISNSADNREYWTFRIRSRSPLLAGYPLVIHSPGATNTNATANDYRASACVLWTNLVGYSAFPVTPFTASTNTNGYATAAFSAPPNTSYTNVATLNYTNISAVTNGIYPTNATGGTATTNTTNISSTIYTNYTGGNTTIVLDPSRYYTNASYSNAILRYDIPATVTNYPYLDAAAHRRYTNATVTALTINGTTSATNALHIISTNASLATVTLSGNNTRKIYMNKSGGDLTLNTANYSGYTNYFALTFSAGASGYHLTVAPPTTAPKTLNLRGGLRTDGNITVTPAGTLVTPVILSNSVDPTPGTNMEYMGDRIMWLEETR